MNGKRNYFSFHHFSIYDIAGIYADGESFGVYYKPYMGITKQQASKRH